MEESAIAGIRTHVDSLVLAFAAGIDTATFTQVSGFFSLEIVHNFGSSRVSIIEQEYQS